jgi:hypothetical protein
LVRFNGVLTLKVGDLDVDDVRGEEEAAAPSTIIGGASTDGGEVFPEAHADGGEIAADAEASDVNTAASAEESAASNDAPSEEDPRMSKCKEIVLYNHVLVRKYISREGEGGRERGGGGC